MPKLCKYIDNLKQPCIYKIPVVPDYSEPIIISRHKDPNDPKQQLMTTQVYRPTHTEDDYCYYHQKLMKGYLYDSKQQSPNKAAQKREAERKLNKETKKDRRDMQYPPSKQA